MKNLEVKKEELLSDKKAPTRRWLFCNSLWRQYLPEQHPCAGARRGAGFYENLHFAFMTYFELGTLSLNQMELKFIFPPFHFWYPKGSWSWFVLVYDNE